MGLCLLANLHDSSSTGENPAVSVHSDSNRSMLAKKVMVPDLAGALGGGILSSTRLTGPSTAGVIVAPLASVVQVGGLEAEWRNLQEQGFSPDIINMLLSSLQVSTKESIVDYGEHPFSASIRLILAFLQSLFNNGLSYNTINVYRS